MNAYRLPLNKSMIILEFFGLLETEFVWEQEMNCILYWIAPVRASYVYLCEREPVV